MPRRLELDRAARIAADGDARAALTALPWLTEQIATDASAGRFLAWGASTAVDEHAGPVIGIDLFDRLHELAGLQANWPVGNAGLLHVYGYLLSVAPTPYGPKRDRWLDGRLALAYGRPADWFLPWHGTTTLLARVTAEASALLDDPEAARREALTGFATRTAVRAAPGAPAAALAYALDDDRGTRLITTFPIDADPAAFLRALDGDAPRLRWNAVARGGATRGG